MISTQQAAYESAATMRRSINMILCEMREFHIASPPPRNEAAMERSRGAAHAYLDAYLDALSAGLVGSSETK